MLASKSGGSFSILEAGLESHFWGGGKSDLFAGSFFVDGEKNWEVSTVVCNPAWELSVEKGWAQMCSVFFKNQKTCPLQLVVAGGRELIPLFVTCSICQ